MYKVDGGIGFGKWTDEVSKFMYFNSVNEILSKVVITPTEKIADYGGGNGNLKNFIPNIITVDKDESKNPDIVDNILQHKGNYDTIVLRYVLHYLNDYEVLQLFNNIESYHKGKVLLIQFTNDDLRGKYKNSVNEFKYFRTTQQLEKLLPPNHSKVYSKEYTVTKEFYVNRLQYKDGTNHQETLNAYVINYDTK